VLETPWATDPEDAVDGVFRAFGPAPTMFRIGMVQQPSTVGIYASNGEGAGAFSVSIQAGTPCGRLASIKLSSEGELGAQSFFLTPAADARRLFTGRPAFTWSEEVMGQQSINDMWFSSSRVAADVYGAIWIADLTSGSVVKAESAPGAEPGDYYAATVSGSDVLVGRRVESRTEWWLHRNGRLAPLLRHAERDITAVATDGKRLVWVEGRDPMPAPAGWPFPVQYAHYSLYESPYAVGPDTLSPRVLVSEVPRDFGQLVLANDTVVGIFLVSHPVYRAAAIVVRPDGEALRSELPDGYSWGYELFPAADALLGPITKGPMLKFETVARVPYAVIPAL
jgi:hypothetical protein